MTLRRGLIFAAVVLAIAAALAALAPVDESSDDSTTGTTTTPPPPAATGAGEVVLRFDAADKPREERVEARTRVIVRVRVPKSGEVSLQERGLSGQVAAAEPGTPAVFDLFLDEPQTLEVVFTPAGGETQRVGTVVVKG